MTEKELYKNKVRIRKYEQTLEYEDEIKKRKEEVDNYIKEIEEENHAIFYKAEFKDDDPNYSCMKEYNIDLINKGTHPIKLVDNGRLLITSYITKEENDKYLHLDMRLAVLKTISEQLQLKLDKIDEFKNHILNCDDSEIIRQVEIHGIGRNIETFEEDEY